MTGTEALFKQTGYVPIIIRLKRSYEVIVGKERFETEEWVNNLNFHFTNQKAHDSIDLIADWVKYQVESITENLLPNMIEEDVEDIAVKIAKILAPLIDYARDNLPKEQTPDKNEKTNHFLIELEKQMELFKAEIYKQLNNKSPIFKLLDDSFDTAETTYKYHFGAIPIVTTTDVPKDQVGIIAGLPYEPDIPIYLGGSEKSQGKPIAIGHTHGGIWFPYPLCDSNCSIHSDKSAHTKAIKITGITNT